jgi:HTH-type transcriptional regulator / antitoxin HigA
MSATLLNERRYEKLVAAALPVVIRTETEYRRLLENARELMDRPDEDLTEEEGRLLELLGLLVEEYEDRVHPLPKADPVKMLRHLLEEKGMQARDLAAILPRSRVSEILNGKRSISKSQAKQLAELFRVSAELFL